MELERKALYSLLRMNYERDPEMDVAEWKVEDYREIGTEEIFERLLDLGVALDEMAFMSYSEQYETPEELSDALSEEGLEVEQQDQIYLLVFELWRRLNPEVLCLSIFCDELDYQIHRYDRSESAEPDDIQDAIENLRNLLEQNLDEGAEPTEAFRELSQACANDLESFLYDFISEQIDDENDSYALELLEGFQDFVNDRKWFDYLRARVAYNEDPKEANKIIRDVAEELELEPNTELYLEILAFLIQSGELPLFVNLVQGACAALDAEEDFLDLLQTCIDFFNCMDREGEESAIQQILERRADRDPEQKIKASDPDIRELNRILDQATSTRSQV